jgi:hypothetical protein
MDTIGPPVIPDPDLLAKNVGLSQESVRTGTRPRASRSPAKRDPYSGACFAGFESKSHHRSPRSSRSSCRNPRASSGVFLVKTPVPGRAPGESVAPEELPDSDAGCASFESTSGLIRPSPGRNYRQLSIVGPDASSVCPDTCIAELSISQLFRLKSGSLVTPEPLTGYLNTPKVGLS